MNKPTRRDFLWASAAFGMSACATGRPFTAHAPAATLDMHVHLFGSGDAGSGCHLSKTVRSSLEFTMLSRLLRIENRKLGIDRGFAQALSQQLASTSIDRVAILAQDCVYDASGRPDMAQTNFFVPNDYVFGFVKQHPNKTIACASINPNRRDCTDELERCASRGARLIKIHPPTQGVDIADRKHKRFFQRCADLNTTVMVHTGHEHAAPVIDIELANPTRMRQGLEEGCRMVACHSGSGWKNDKPDYFGEFLALVKDYDKAYGDTSVMATMKRSTDLMRAINETSLSDRLVHGSDFPFPSWPLAFSQEIGRKEAFRLQKNQNLLDRDYELKGLLGIGVKSAERGHRLIFG